MKTICRIADLEKFGIIPLTGEADALSYRILCDLTAFGRHLVCEAYGLPAGSAGFAENWNSGSKDTPHVGCIMLQWDAWKQIGPIALIRDCRIVFSTDKDGALFGIESGEEFTRGEYDWIDTSDEIITVKPPMIDGMTWPESCYGKIQRYFAYGSHPRVGSRNLHAMSGRSI